MNDKERRMFMSDHEISQLLELLKPSKNYVTLCRITILGVIGGVVLWVLLHDLCDDLLRPLWSALVLIFFAGLGQSMWWVIESKRKTREKVMKFLLGDKTSLG